MNKLNRQIEWSLPSGAGLFWILSHQFGTYLKAKHAAIHSIPFIRFVRSCEGNRCLSKSLAEANCFGFLDILPRGLPCVSSGFKLLGRGREGWLEAFFVWLKSWSRKRCDFRNPQMSTHPQWIFKGCHVLQRDDGSRCSPQAQETSGSTRSTWMSQTFYRYCGFFGLVTNSPGVITHVYPRLPEDGSWL